jgi:hypothetical protein
MLSRPMQQRSIIGNSTMTCRIAVYRVLHTHASFARKQGDPIQCEASERRMIYRPQGRSRGLFPCDTFSSDMRMIIAGSERISTRVWWCLWMSGRVGYASRTSSQPRGDRMEFPQKVCPLSVRISCIETPEWRCWGDIYADWEGFSRL